MGRGAEMTWDNAKYIKLLVSRSDKARDVYLIALRTTANYYGWSEQFEPWSPEPAYRENGKEFFYDSGRRGEMFCERGNIHRICRSPSRRGNPAGFTNKFKVSRNATLFDLSEVAYLTKGDWHWMSGPEGIRRTRDEWLAIHTAGISRKERGLVSV